MNQLALDLQSVTPEYRTIPLTQGQCVIVDASDYEALSRHKWFAQWMPCTGSFYARRQAKGVGKRQECINMHRAIIGLDSIPEGMMVDHANHDTLDNRRKNLRVVSRSQNVQNSRVRRDKSSVAAKGVTKTGNGKWVARIRVNGKVLHCGRFLEMQDAEAAYRAAATLHFGEYAHF